MDPSLLRAETIRRFARWGLVPNEHLPVLESLADLSLKSAEAVAARAVIAGYIAAVCFGAPGSKVRKDLEQLDLWRHVTAEEQELFAASPSIESLAFHGWLIESIQFLAWSLGLVPLDHFTECSESLASHFPRPGTDPGDFIFRATLRPVEELLQEADTLYMLHWRAVENNLMGTPDARILLPRVSFRRHAADWAVGVDEAWEDVPLDT